MRWLLLLTLASCDESSIKVFGYKDHEVSISVRAVKPQVIQVPIFIRYPVLMTAERP